jgi:hypothetical protein
MVLLSLVANKEGGVSNIQIVAPSGLGLDEKAVETVSA